MNIVIINSADKGGGAENINLNLNQFYNLKNHNSKMFVGKKKTRLPNVLKIENKSFENPFIKIAKQLANNTHPAFGNLMKLMAVPNYRSNFLGHEPMYYPGTKKLLSIISKEIDIVHLGNLHGKYFDLRMLPEISKKVPTVLRLSDMWLFTGHCAQSLDCSKWENGCGNCPYLNSYPSINKDATRFNFKVKRRILNKSRLYVSTPSKWLMNKVDKSILKSSIIDSRIIPTGIDLDYFSKGNKVKCKKKLNLDIDGIVIFIYASGHKAYKWGYLTKLLNLFRQENNFSSKVSILVVGQSGAIEKKKYLNIFHLGYIDSKDQYKQYLQSSDLYVHLSESDTYPNAIMEALSCGIPSIAFNVGGIPEQIIPYNNQSKHFQSAEVANGALISKGDVVHMNEIVKDLEKCENMRHILSINATKFSRKNFSFSNYANNYLNWYKEILQSFKM